MVKCGNYICPKCGGELVYYDHVNRICRGKYGVKDHLVLTRYKCKQCGSVHRAIPDDILPYKQYDAEIIRGVVQGLITIWTLGYEDHPCEMTMVRWIRVFSKFYNED